MNCNICNGMHIKKYLNSKKHHPTYWKCNDCNLVFSYPQVEFDYQNFKYTPLNEIELETRIKNYELRWNIIKNYIHVDKNKILDIGTNDGTFLYYLQSQSLYPEGMEVNTKAIKHGKEKYNVNIINGNFEDYGFNEKYDVITMLNVLEHVKNPRDILNKINSITLSKALLILELPNIFHTLASMSYGYWHHFHNSHNWFFDNKNIIKLVSEYGYDIKYIDYIPKITSFAKVFDILMSSIQVYRYVSIERHNKIKSSMIYKSLNKKIIKLCMDDYMFAVFEKNV